MAKRASHPQTRAKSRGRAETFHVRWQNFRGLHDTGWLAIKRLTILIGPNGNGKTSVIALLLLQSPHASDAAREHQVPSGRVRVRQAGVRAHVERIRAGGRTVIANLGNYQEKDGSVTVPRAHCGSISTAPTGSRSSAYRAKLIRTIVVTGTGTPFRSVGMYSHCRTASSAA